MNTLFLDFCSHRKVFALVRDKKVFTCELEDHTDEASVMPAIESLITKAGCALKDIERIAAVTGPGGFMSQRIGLSIANALGWSLHIPIGGLHLSDLFAARIDGNVLWLHSTKKQLLFIRGFGSYAVAWPEPVMITLDELKKIMDGSYVGEVLPEQASVLNIKPLATLQSLSVVLPDIVSNVTYKTASLTPWYGRGA